jgi:hypothetical protein
MFGNLTSKSELKESAKAPEEHNMGTSSLSGQDIQNRTGPVSSQDVSYLCQACRHVFSGVKLQKEDDRMVYEHLEIKSLQQSIQEGCQFCKILWSGLQHEKDGVLLKLAGETLGKYEIETDRADASYRLSFFYDAGDYYVLIWIDMLDTKRKIFEVKSYNTLRTEMCRTGRSEGHTKHIQQHLIRCKLGYCLDVA